MPSLPSQIHHPYLLRTPGNTPDTVVFTGLSKQNAWSEYAILYSGLFVGGACTHSFTFAYNNPQISIHHFCVGNLSYFRGTSIHCAVIPSDTERISYDREHTLKIYRNSDYRYMKIRIKQTTLHRFLKVMWCGTPVVLLSKHPHGTTTFRKTSFRDPNPETCIKCEVISV